VAAGGQGARLQKPRLAPNSAISGGEFAALVRTLPEAEQRKIEAVMDLIHEDRIH
jgi:hypothetical protein